MISLICPFHNDSKWIPRLIDSILWQTVYDSVEVVFVDNASNPQELKVLREEAKRLKRYNIIHTGGDKGFCYACNLGAKVALGRFLYFINPDCWMEPDCLNWLSSVCYHDRLIFAKLLDYDSNKRQCERWTGFDIFGNSVHGHGLAFSQSGFTFTSRTWFQILGGFDEEHFMYGEEEDLSWRTWIMGGEVAECELARVHHRNHHSEYHATNESRFLINRNCLMRLCKNAQHILTILIIPLSMWILAEGIASFVLYGASSAYHIGVRPFLSLWEKRRLVMRMRKLINQRRVRSDWFLMKFFRPWKFGKTDELKKIIKIGLPNLG